MNKLLAATVVGIVMTIPLATFAPVAFGATVQATSTERVTTFAVENMTCGLCPITVKKAMEKVEGVRSVSVDLDAKTATVTYDPIIATPKAIGAASADAGYPAVPSS